MLALWNSGIHSSGEISSKLNISGHTVVRYLKRGVDLGLCDYNFDEAKKEQGRRNRGKNNYRSTPVICLTTKKLFFSQAEGKNYYNIKNNGDISRCCSGATKYAGELKDGTKLVWKYINYKHNKKYRIKSK